MKNLRRPIVGLVWTCLGWALLGPVAGCSTSGSATPQHDPVESRKVKDDILKGVAKPGFARPGQKASTAEDRF